MGEGGWQIFPLAAEHLPPTISTLPASASMGDTGQQRRHTHNTHRGLPPAHIESRLMMFLHGALFVCYPSLVPRLALKWRAVVRSSHVEGHDESQAPHTNCAHACMSGHQSCIGAYVPISQPSFSSTVPLKGHQGDEVLAHQICRSFDSRNTWTRSLMTVDDFPTLRNSSDMRPKKRRDPTAICQSRD